MTEVADVLGDPSLDLFAPATADDPHHTYRELRTRCPVHRGGPGQVPGVMIFDHETVMWALRHPEVFSSGSEGLDIGQEQPLIPLQIDPPLHTAYRRLMNPPFTPKRVAELEPDVRTYVRGLVEGLCDGGQCDFHEDFATPLPSTIFLRLMGLPQSDLATMLQWRDNIIRPDVDPADLDAAAAVREATSKEINAYFEAAIDAARRDGGEGLLGELVAAEMEGRPLSQQELLGICHLMMLGGLDTVTATLDCMIVYLARHPDQRRKLVEDPSLIPAAIEELLRHQTPVMVVPRIIAQPITLRDVDLEVGDLAMLVIGAANGDEAEFAEPHEVDFTRDDNRHLAFGGGHHLCLGAHLARLELRVALEEFHAKIPEYRIPDGADVHFSGGIRQASQLPLVWP